MNRRLIGFMILFTFITFILMGCSGNYSPNRLHRTVKPHPNQEGTYLVYYRRHNMIEEFGPGLVKVRDMVRQAKNIEDKLAVWDQALAFAVPKYLEAKDLIPIECVKGVFVVSSSSDEAGGGTTAFRCK